MMGRTSPDGQGTSYDKRPGLRRSSRLRRLQLGLHDERVLAGVVVVAAPAPHHAEAEGGVEPARLGVGRAYLENDQPEPPPPGILEDAGQERPGDAAAAPRRVQGHVRDVDLV